MDLPQRDYHPVQEVLDDTKAKFSDLIYCVEKHFLRILLDITPKRGCEVLRLSKSQYWTPMGITIRGFFVIEGRSINAIRTGLPVRRVYDTEYTYWGKRQCYKLLNNNFFTIDDLYMEAAAVQRFKELHGFTTKTDKPTRRIIINELHEVIWAAYLALEKRHSSKPTSGELWQELKRNHDRYDKDGCIQEIKKETIFWMCANDHSHTLKRVSFPATLCTIKKKKPN